MLLLSLGMLTAGAGTLASGGAAAPAAPALAAPAAKPLPPAPPPQQDAPTGELLVVPGVGPAAGTGELIAYRVEVEAGLAADATAFAAQVQQTLGHPSGWAPIDQISLHCTDSAAASTVTLASAATTDLLCAPLTTEGKYSCFNGDRAVINIDRWRNGAATYGADLTGYRQYLLNHEVGHALGRRHTRCPTAGVPAPVMVQQTISLDGCTPNPWPQVTAG